MAQLFFGWQPIDQSIFWPFSFSVRLFKRYEKIVYLIWVANDLGFGV